MARVHVSPDPFTMVSFDAAVIAGVAEDVASRIGFPDDVEVSIEVDEALPLPLTGSYADIVDGRASLWYSGGTFEDPHRTRGFEEPVARVCLGRDLLRAADRLTPEFADAPADADLTDQQRAAWDAWADGRLVRLGFSIRTPLRRYHFRLAHGFNDVVDAVQERLWHADALRWSDIDAACAETAAVDTRVKPKGRAGKDRGSLRTSA